MTDAQCDDALLAARLFALDPAGMVLHLKSAAGPARDAFLALLAPLRRCPLGIGDDRLLGGLDLSATLACGRRIASRGLLAQADGGLLALPMAERLTRETAARLCVVLDTGEVLAERDGVALRDPARFGLVLLDEGVDDEVPPAALLERAAFRIALPPRGDKFGAIGDLAAARARLALVRCDVGIMEALCAAAQAFGIASLRAPLLALRVARAAAALAGRDKVGEAEAALAARLVLSWRATVLPQAEPQPREAQESQQSQQQPEPSNVSEKTNPEEADSQQADIDAADGMAERLVEAAQASLPADLLERLRGQAGSGTAPAGGGRSESAPPRLSPHGRPLHPRAGRPTGSARLAVVETLRAAAPWQAVRRSSSARGFAKTPAKAPRSDEAGKRVEVRATDFRVAPRAQTPRSVAIFVVDASGSAAMNRLAEAKGAIERLLGDCYVRRDRVALIAFRGREADLLLPPTSALTRARRSLAGLPGGGGTPLAAGLDAATTLALSLRKRGETPLVVLLTDGRANVTQAGMADRALAAEEAGTCAARLRAAGIAGLLVDISPRAEARAEALAGQMGALYLKLPDAAALSRAVREARAA